MTSNEVNERRVARSNKIWKHRLPTVRTTLCLQRATGCPSAVESYCQIKYGSKLNEDQR